VIYIQVYILCLHNTIPFVACDDLYTQAIDFTNKCNGQVQRIEQLENRLGQHSSAYGKKDMVQYSLAKLQEEMEVISLSIKRRQEALQKATSLFTDIMLHVYA